MARDLVVGLDPGVTIGIAIVDVSTAFKPHPFYASTAPDPHAIANYLSMLSDDKHSHIRAVVVEDFIGAGARDAHKVHTIKVLGFLQWWCERMGWEVEVRVPQVRKAFVDQAVQALPVGTSIHSVDAYAHALAWIHDRLQRQPIKAVK